MENVASTKAVKKFSEYMAEGRGLLKLCPWVYLEEDGGCLIGMAVVACAGPQADAAMVQRARALFPWLSKELPLPTAWNAYEGYDRKFSVESILGRFAYLIAEGKSTFEDALEWVRENEPRTEAA